MTLFDVEELGEYWASHPPVHLMVAAFLGVKPERGGKSGRGQAERVDQLRAEAPHLFAAGADVLQGLGPVTLDLAELKRRSAA
jgi:hypothetical protein